MGRSIRNMDSENKKLLKRLEEAETDEEKLAIEKQLLANTRNWNADSGEDVQEPPEEPAGS